MVSEREDQTKLLLDRISASTSSIIVDEMNERKKNTYYLIEIGCKCNKQKEKENNQNLVKQTKLNY